MWEGCSLEGVCKDLNQQDDQNDQESWQKISDTDKKAQRKQIIGKWGVMDIRGVQQETSKEYRYM